MEDHWDLLRKVLPAEVADLGRLEAATVSMFLEAVDLSQVLLTNLRCSTKVGKWLQGHLEHLRTQRISGRCSGHCIKNASFVI